MPLAVYLFVLAQLNRRPHPVVVSGTWDFAGILFALSGFLLLGGPFIMATINQDWRDFWVSTPLRSFEGLSGGWYYLRLLIWGLYFLTVAAGSILLLRWRSKVTSIYNVSAEAFNQSLAESLDRLQFPWRRSRNRVYIGRPNFTDGQPLQGNRGSEIEHQATEIAEKPENSISVASVFSGAPGRIFDPQSTAAVARYTNDSQDSQDAKSVLEIDPFPAMHHVTLRWPTESGALRSEVEASLAKVLANVETTYNPAAVWLMSAATVLLSAVSFGLIIMILFVIFVFYGN
jgi:hypothetical protein